MDFFTSFVSPCLINRMSNKGQLTRKNTVLLEDDKLVCDQNEVCEIFNDFFVHVARDIGQNSIPVNNDHPSLCKIRAKMGPNDVFAFREVTEDFVEKQINSFSVKKATGHDGISAKILKHAKPVFVRPITRLVNLSLKPSIEISTSCYCA